jgi:multidrug efflux pump subunit AcrA (membrane-fusion protein)
VKKLFVLLCLPLLSLLAKEYFSKVEPYEVRTVASNVAGLVIFANEELEGSLLGKEAYLRIDDELDRVDLDKTRSKIILLKNAIKLNEQMSANYEEIVAMKGANYERVKQLKMRSQVEKDREYYDFIGTQNQLIGLEKETENMKIQVNDLEMLERRLQRSIADKSQSAPGYMLYALMVQESQVVNPGTPLAQIADVRKAKLTVYLSSDERKGVEKRVIYIDGKKSAYRIDRLWNIADAKHLSSYKAEIVIDAPEQFSRLVKVEFKDE